MERSNRTLATGALGVLMLLTGQAVGGAGVLEARAAPAKQKQSEPASKQRAPSKESSPSRQTQPTRRAAPSRQAQPKRSQPASRPARSEPARTRPTSRPARSEPARTQPARTQPSRTQPARTQPQRTTPSRVTPSRTEPSRTQPTNTQPAKTQPSRIQPSRVEPSKIQPSKVQPSKVQPSRVEPSRVSPSRVQPAPVAPSRKDGAQDNPVGPDVNTRPSTGGPSTGVVRRGVSAGQIAPSVRKAGTPGDFDIDRARTNFIKRVGGGKAGVGGRMGEHPDESGGHHDDGHHDDGHHDDHYDDHHDDDWHIDIDINFWSHPTYCPGGWWYVYSDFNHDGYTDYVCTNGSYSVYWYGWSGAYWDCSPWYGWYSNRYNYRWWSYSIPDSYRGVVYGVNDELVDQPGPPATVSVEAPPEAIPLSAVEVARLEMSLGQPEVAIEAYRAHLSEYPDDWMALRELGLAMIRNGQRGDGVAMIGYAYSQDPLLAYDIIPVELFGGDAHELRDAVVRVVGWGHRNPSASAWLSVAVLMQGEGRDGPALKMIERAQQLGLDPAVADQMRGALIQR